MSATARTRPAQEQAGASDSHWPLERVLFALEGSITLISAALAALISPWVVRLTAFVGVNQWLYVLFAACPASLVLRRLFSLRSVLHPRQEAHP